MSFWELDFGLSSKRRGPPKRRQVAEDSAVSTVFFLFWLIPLKVEKPSMKQFPACILTKYDTRNRNKSLRIWMNLDWFQETTGVLQRGGNLQPYSGNILCLINWGQGEGLSSVNALIQTKVFSKWTWFVVIIALTRTNPFSAQAKTNWPIW